MSLILHSHPLSSCCWKVLIALYENGAAFEARMVDLGNPQARAAFAALWPTAKIPLLQDGERIVPETSIMIEHLDLQYPGRTPLLPRDPDARLEVRLWDRLFDLYVMTPMQRLTGQRLRPEADRDAGTTAEALGLLAMAYQMINEKLAGRTWAAGPAFSMADCAAAPALFYSTIYLPIPEGHANLAAYVERLMARPSVCRVIADARPYFKYFPLADEIPRRFMSDGQGG